jgi:2'-5' RNA ligase
VPGIDDITGVGDPDWAAFASLDRLTNHWDRSGWCPGRSAYYWYLSFRDQHEVQALAESCQIAVAGPHFDLIDYSDLHMTLERVAFVDEIDATRLEHVEKNARAALRKFPNLHLRIGPLAGSGSALSFSATPKARLHELRSHLLSATHSAGLATDIPISRSFRPHVGIGYCNRTIDAVPIIEQVRALRALPPVTVCISEVVLVALTRHERAYSWDVAYRLPLASEN